MENNNKPVRRVGTFTMGLYLIIAGVIALIATFTPNFDFMFILKLTPIVFLLLGTEVLFYHFALKTEKIKYDIFSIFICLVLIGATICTACVPWLLSFWGPEREIKTQQIQSELYDKCQNALSNNIDILTIRPTANVTYHMTDYSEITSDNVSKYLRITFVPTIDTKEKFAKSVKNVVTTFRNNNISFDSVHFYSKNSDLELELSLDNTFTNNLTESTIESMIEND